jgi:hypothetical protein
MLVFKFREEGSSRIALATDARGEGLPKDGRVWACLGKVDLAAADDLQHIGASPEEVARALRADGCFVWPR